MPDHGLRLPPYSVNPGLYGEANFPAEQLAYERIDAAGFKERAAAWDGKGNPNVTKSVSMANPPFLGAGQMLGPQGPPSWMKQVSGTGINRILRGFIRRQVADPADEKSSTRLMFMWNPDEVRRQYISAMDTNVADVANQTGQNPADSPVAYAAVNATFSLFFDRQTEVATIPNHPGVLVDLLTFDNLAGTMTATGTQQYTGDADTDSSAGLAPSDTPPDAGETAVGMTPSALGKSMVMTPMAVAAVFAPTLAFYGVLMAAEVTFTKFSSRMVPTAMMLQITMNLNSVGGVAKQTVGGVGGGGPMDAVNPAGPGMNPSYVYDPAAPPTPDKVLQVNAQGPAQAHNWGLQYIGKPYDHTMKIRMDGAPCNNKPFWSDCSSFVYRCYKAVNWTKILGLGDSCAGAPDTAEWQRVVSTRSDVWDAKAIHRDEAWASTLIRNCLPGDIFVRGRTGTTAKGGSNGHIVMFSGFTSGNGPSYSDKNCLCLHSTPEMIKRDTKNGKYFTDNYNYWARPRPFK